MSESKLRFGEILVRAGLLDAPRLEAALAEQKKWGGRLGRVLVDLGFVDEPTVVAALSHHLHLTAIDLQATPPPPEATQLLAVQDCERHGVFPLSADLDRKLLRLATSDPTNYETLRHLELRTRMKIEPVVAAGTDIDRAIRRYYYGDSLDQRPVQVPRWMESDAPQPAGSAPAGAVPPPLPSPAAPVRMESPSEVAELHGRVARLEDLVGRQTRALRALVEMLVDQGGLDRADYIRRVRGDDPEST
ncbi:MAG: general secretion pathway protein GspE [Deltaproteobacteria bacterium]|nr:general secretion pathway protein GspE [Deltaproteobacteria bacterium]